MMRLFSCFFLLTIVSFLSGCGPIYKTEYSYVPPRSDGGKMCISQCVQNKSVQEQMCQMRRDECRAEARERAHHEYEHYKHEREREGKKIKKDTNDFDYGYTCNDSCDTTPNFNICYSGCGGQVLSRQVCVAFCGDH